MHLRVWEYSPEIHWKARERPLMNFEETSFQSIKHESNTMFYTSNLAQYTEITLIFNGLKMGKGFNPILDSLYLTRKSDCGMKN